MIHRDEQNTTEEMITKRRPAAPERGSRDVDGTMATERTEGTRRSIRDAREQVRAREAVEERRQIRRPVRPTGEIPAEDVRRTARPTGEIPAERVNRTTRPVRPTGEIPAEGVRRTARPTGEIPAERVNRTTRPVRPTGEIPAEGVRRTARPTGEIPAERVNRTVRPVRPTGEIPAEGVRRTARPTGEIPAERVNRTARPVRPAGEIPAEGVRRTARPTGEIPAERVNRTVRPARPTEEIPAGGGQPPKQPPRKPAGQSSGVPKKSGKGAHIAAGILMFLAVIAIAVVFVLKGGISANVIKAATTDLNAYYDLGPGEARLVLNGTTHELRGYVSDGEFYAPYELVENTLNNRIYFDQNEQMLLYTLDSSTIEIHDGDSTYTKDGEQVENGSAVFVMNGDVPYISMTFVKAFTNLEYSTFTDPSRLVIVTDGMTLPCAEAKSTEVKESADNGAINMTVLEKDEPVWILEEGEKWCHIMSEKGIAGYVKTKKLGKITEKTYSFDFEEPEFHSIHRDHTIRMAWHQVMGMGGNDTLGNMTAGTAINTIAPTWFYLTDTDGGVASIASGDYVAQAHAAGLEVWAVVNDFDGAELYGGPNSADETYALLSSTSKRRRLESTLINEVVNCGADGINVDFEKVNEACGSHYIQFIRELSVLCGQNNLILSVDSYVPSAWTVQYHREEQNLYADYVVIMAYDENGSWSTEIGPNSSLNYVEDAIHDTLKVVDAQKMILGIPFYTRLWWESADPNEAAAQGFSCTTLTMQEQASTLAVRNYDSVWDDARGTNCVTYEENGNRYTLWVEDADSLKLKLDCMKESGLAGFSAWKLGQETSDVWGVLGQY